MTPKNQGERMSDDLNRVGLNYMDTDAESPTRAPRRSVVVPKPEKTTRQVDRELLDKVVEQVNEAGGMICEPLVESPSVIIAAPRPPPVPWDGLEEEDAWERLISAVQEHEDNVHVIVALVPEPSYMGDRILIGTDLEALREAHDRHFG